MNAKELLADLDAWAKAEGSCTFPEDALEVLQRALRLLAAAERNDGERSQLIEELRTEADLCRNETADDVADLLDDAASSLIATGALFNALKDERNGLAARVGELSADVERAAKDVQRVAEEMATKMAAPAHARAEKAEAERDAFKRHAEEVKRDLAASVVKSAGLEEENSKLRSALAIVHFKREPWQ